MTDYLVRASSLSGIRSAIVSLGADPDELNLLTQLEAAALDEESWISYSSFLTLLQESAQLTDCPHFGLSLSQHQDISILGTLGYIMQQAPDLRTALLELAKYFAYHNQGAKISLTVEKGIALWRFDCELEGVLPVTQQVDLVAGLALDVMRLLWTPKWSPDVVYFPHATPVDIKPYQKRFDCPLQFDWESLTVAFDAAILDQAILDANPQLHSVFEKYLRNIAASFSDDYCGQIKHIIKHALSTGDISIERVAGLLGVNKRTLQRQLARHNTSYKDLLEEVRFNAARRYLLESNGSLTNLADMLGYSELSVFSSAFRRDHGVSPRQWRQQHLAH